MPTYEFHCSDCGYTFDVFTTVAEKERREREHDLTCEKCGSDKVEQLFGGISIVTGTRMSQDRGGDSGCCGGGNCC